MKKSEKTSVQAILNRAREFHPIIDKIEVTPDRQIHPGDSVYIGCLRNVEVLETFNEGRWILVEYDTLNQDRDEKVKGLQRTQDIFPWTAVDKKLEKTVDFAPDPVNDFFGHFSNTALESLINMYISDRLEFNSEYQRDYVWSQEDKDKLFDSIFDGKDIGKFIFIKHPFPRKMDILDGKQRLTTIIDFFLGKISYRGIKWNELSPLSRSIFGDRTIQKVEIEGAKFKKSDFLKMFINVNSAGVPQTEEHMNKIHAMYAAALAEENHKHRPKM